MTSRSRKAAAPSRVEETATAPAASASASVSVPPVTSPPSSPTVGASPEPAAVSVSDTDAANPPGPGVPGGSSLPGSLVSEAPVVPITPAVRVRCKVDGFRRGGIVHFRAPRDFAAGELSAEAWQAIRDEPLLIVQLTDGENGP